MPVLWIRTYSRSMSSTFEAKKALIVHAHPESASFCTSQMQAARDELVRQGYEVDVIDLYENKLDPVLDRGMSKSRSSRRTST